MQVFILGVVHEVFFVRYCFRGTYCQTLLRTMSGASNYPLTVKWGPAYIGMFLMFDFP